MDVTDQYAILGFILYLRLLDSHILRSLAANMYILYKYIVNVTINF